MKNLLLVVFIIFSFGLIVFPARAQDTFENVNLDGSGIEKTQSTVKSNKVCTKVGNPSGTSPCEGTEVAPPGVVTPPTGPIPQTGCKDEQGNDITCPRPTAPNIPDSELIGALKDKFGITLSGFGNNYARALWEKMWEVSNTKFPELVKGALITVGAGSQTGCKEVNVPLVPSQETFTILVFHELGHVIRNCSSRGDSAWDTHLAAIASEGYVSIYSNNPCTYSAQELEKNRDWIHQSEDYAEMITYYLHQDKRQQTVRCAGGGTNPFADGAAPAHFEAVKQILGPY